MNDPPIAVGGIPEFSHNLCGWWDCSNQIESLTQRDDTHSCDGFKLDTAHVVTDNAIAINQDKPGDP